MGYIQQVNKHPQVEQAVLCSPLFEKKSLLFYGFIIIIIIIVYFFHV